MATRDTIETLRRTPLLGLLHADALQVLANVADARQLARGEILFRESDRSDGGYAVMAGEIAVGPDGRDGEAEIFGPGSLIGRMALFLRMQRTATAVARSDAAVLRVSPTLMKRVLEEYPASVGPVSRALSADLGVLTAELETVHARLAAMEAGGPGLDVA